MKEKFDAKKVMKWHEALHNDNNRGDRAKLRRCKKVADIYLQPAYANLVSMLGQTNNVLPVIAGVLAHKVKEKPENSRTFAEAMAAGDKPITPIRFRQLLACKSNDKLLRMLIRIIKQIEFSNLESFIADLYFWHAKNNHTKKNWALDYYRHLSSEFLTQGE